MAQEPNNLYDQSLDLDAAGSPPASFQTDPPGQSNKSKLNSPKGGSGFKLPKIKDGVAAFKNDVKNQAVDGGLAFAADKLKEKQQDEGFQKKYGIAGDIAGKALDKAQSHRAGGGELKMADAGRIAKQAAIETGKERIKHSAVQRMERLVAKHPELAGDLGKLAEVLGTKKLDLSGRKGDQLIDKGARRLAKQGLENLAKQGAKAGAKAGVSAAANQAVPFVGAISATDAVRGTARGLKQVKEGHLIKGAATAAKGVATSGLITLFNLSIQWEIVGWSLGLSLLVSLVVGNILLFTKNRGFTFEKKLLVIAADILLFIIFVGCLISVLVMFCSGLNVPGLLLKIASYFSSTANSANEVCKTFSIFNVLSGGFGQ